MAYAMPARVSCVHAKTLFKYFELRNLQKVLEKLAQTASPAWGSGTLFARRRFLLDTLPHCGTFPRLIAAIVILLAARSGVAAESTQALTNAPELSLEQLINLDVTSVSKKDTKLSQSPAAISVITQEDIERSGATTIPDALRMVPGVDVAQINSSTWAVSARGFNSQYADKLLVLVDGRSVYNNAFAGVVWGVQDLVLADLERIEVIRGPGASLWGANAVNGVINIITKSAKETQGLLVSTSAGTEFQPSTSIRYGDQIATNLFYRVYVKYVNADGFTDAYREGLDDWNSLRGGGRLDWEATEGDLVTIQGDFYSGDFGQYAQEPLLSPPYTTSVDYTSRLHGNNILGRWTHDFSEQSQLTLQAYFDHSVDLDAGVEGIFDVYDVDLQHRFALGERQDIIWGAGYRYYPDNLLPSPVSTFSPQSRHDQLFSWFVQDDVTVVPDRLHFIAGSKFEHNDYTGFEVQPSARLLWTPTENQTLWGAVSRAVRTPSRYDTGINFNLITIPPGTPQNPSPFPALVTVLGNPNQEAEHLTAYELGYRVEPVPQLAFDVAGFYNVYDDLMNFTTGTPVFQFAPVPHTVIPQLIDNTMRGESFGAELSAQWRVTDNWRLMASYSWEHTSLHPVNNPAQGDGPENQAQLRSYLDLPFHLELNNALYYVDELADQGVPSYVRLDAGIIWRPCKSWSFGVFGQNLLQDHHAEFDSQRSPIVSEVPRTIYGKVTWVF